MCSSIKKKSPNVTELRALHPKIEKVFDRLMNDLLQGHLIGSTLVEGSKFTEQEAREVLSGKTIHGHRIDEHLELLNGKLAASYLHRLFFEKESITQKLLDQAHQLLFSGIGNPADKNPGKNRGTTNQAAFTTILARGELTEFEYEHPLKIRSDYQPFIAGHINSPLPGNRNDALLSLAKMYFHFQMLHPYADGNGRLGRFIVSAKAASEKGWFFRFEKKDGPEHLRIMMDLTLDYKAGVSLDYRELILFFDLHLEQYDSTE